MATNISNGDTGSASRTKINNAFTELNTATANIATLITDLNTEEAAFAAHAARVDNPHTVTKTQVGLGNCDNTSDANKPISTLTQTALDNKQAINAQNNTSTKVTQSVTHQTLADNDYDTLFHFNLASGANFVINTGLSMPIGKTFWVYNDDLSANAVSITGTATKKYANSTNATIAAGVCSQWKKIDTDTYLRMF